MSIDQIKPLPTEVLELPDYQGVQYTYGAEDDQALSLGEIMDHNFSQNSIDLDHSPPAQAEPEEKADTLSMVMSHDSPVFQVKFKGISIDEFSLHPNKDPFDLQPKEELRLNLENPLPDFGNNSPNDNSPLWSLNAHDIKSEIRALETPATTGLNSTKSTTIASAFKKDSRNEPANKISDKNNNPSSDGLPPKMKFNRHFSETSNTRKKWAKLGNVIHSLALLQRQEVKNIVRSDDMNAEITSFNIGQTKPVSASARTHDFLAKNDFAGDAFDFVRRVQMFCECAAIGSPEHIKEMIKMIDRDPKKFILEPNDPQHLLNKTNNQGWTPLYIAAKYGNLEVVKLLIEKKANYQIKCRANPNQSKEELPIKVASKWGYAEVVDYLLKNGEYDNKTIKSCIKKSSNLTVRTTLQKYQKEVLRSKSEVSIFSKWFLK